MVPGFRAPLKLSVPLVRCLSYGSPSSLSFSVSDLNRLLLAKVNHKGSDIKITTGEVLSPKSVPRQSVEASWWQWEPVFKLKWKQREHINILAARNPFKRQTPNSSLQRYTYIRLFHVSDSFVAMSVIAQGRTGSHQLGAVLRLLNAHLLGYGLTLALGHVESTKNPTDGESRSMAVLF